MILTCPACDTRYSVDPNSLVPNGRTVRCAKCGHSWKEHPPADMPRTVAEAPMPMATAAEEEPADADAGADDVEVPSIEEMTVQASRPMKRTVRTKKVQKPKLAWGVIAGWGVFATVLIGLIGGAFFLRNTIMEAWPPATKLYELAGMSAPKKQTLAFSKPPTAQWEMDGETRVIVVSGAITNVSDEQQALPKLQGVLLDARQPPREIFTWTFDPPVAMLDPGATKEFATRVPNPPAATRGVGVTMLVGAPKEGK